MCCVKVAFARRGMWPARSLRRFVPSHETPGQGHRRPDLTERDELRVWSVFSYLTVYRTDKKPMTIVAIVHGKRDVQHILKER
jgi:plasmid stabilization system protein ParE